MTQLPRPGLITAALILVADQLVKWWVTGPLDLRFADQVGVLPFFRFTWAENRGVSLGLLSGETPASRWLLVALTGAISLGVLYWMTREKLRADIIALGLVLGGALGNIIDRVRQGFVTDYADLHFGEFRPFMIFNLADAAISIGVVIILARSLLLREKPPQKSAPDAPET
ncbi:MAG: signal peptidase II [Novosphingobium sp.]